MKQYISLSRVIAGLTLFLAAALSFAAPVTYEETLADTVPTYSSTSPATDFEFITVADKVVEAPGFYQDLYPYALMSYFAEMYKTTSSKESKQKALSLREKKLTDAGYVPVEDITFIPQALRPLFIHDKLPRKVKESSLILNGFYDASSQLRARLFINLNKKTLALAIAGTDFTSPTSMLSAIQLGAGHVSAAARTARKIAVELQKLYPDFTIELTGASQGGAIAQYAAVTKNIRAKAIVFNSLALPPAVTRTLSDKQRNRIQHTYVQGEILNGDIYHPMALLQNVMPVQGNIIPVSEDLEEILTKNFYNSYSYWRAPFYYFSTDSGMLHWTGSLLRAMEYYAGYNNLPSLY